MMLGTITVLLLGPGISILKKKKERMSQALDVEE
jgi:hypothetical protein